MRISLPTDFTGKPYRPFKRGKTYHVRMWINGKDVWRSLHTTKLKEAEAIAYRLWHTHQKVDVRSMIALPEYPPESCWEAYAKTERYKLLSVSTARTHDRVWQTFVKWMVKRKISSIHSVTPDMAEEYLSERGNTNKTFNNCLQILKSIFDPLCRSVGKENPFASVQPRITSRGEKASSQFRAFTEEEIGRILDYISASDKISAKDEWRSACMIALSTGLRFKDVATLRWSSVKGDFIELVPSKTKNKVGKAVLLRINATLRRILDESRNDSEFILPHIGSTYDEHNSSQAFMRVLRSLKIDDTDAGKAGFHSFRATVATKAAQAGIDLKDFGGVLGHTTKAQTEHYNKASAEIDLSFLDR